MSHIPNCREKYERDARLFHPARALATDNSSINPYWYGLLRGKDAEFVRGFDWAVDDVINHIFDNLILFESQLNDMGIVLDDIDENIVNGACPMQNHTTPYDGDTRECYWYNNLSDDELDTMTDSTRKMLLLKNMLNLYAEVQRDELVTVLIEGMNEEEYEKAVKEEEE